ncbi:MAG TPA: biotin carboxylase N-terminal domain-containing protein [Candidatus Limnocylindria bacterium]|nr:biotin carboxylase N-terminal domain-containing protein [Candidatus Limnocylindria bacterium]
MRVFRTCRELEIESVAVFSEADAGAVHVRVADAAEPIGPAPAIDSYLNIGAVIDAARRSRSEAIHPGYGFLSENAEFAHAVEDAGLVFIGPPPAALEALGNKLAARRAAADAGVPIVPGTTVALAADADLDGVGLPAMLKAAAGGGGRGMRVVTERDQLADALATASREAFAAFGDGTIYVEQLIAPAHHVEVQLLGDRHGGLAVLGERDCSIQRRHQKLVEETPSPVIDDDLRDALFASARAVARTVDFHNAATVEFLIDADGSHYFLEMNTRLQVEHGVTELATGLDLVAWQIRVAAGESLPASVTEAVPRGHAIEVRLYAEDPYDGFRPAAGRVTAWQMPAGPGVRIDAGVEADTDLPPEYDPLLAKLMVHAEDRPAALRRLRRALDETLIGGLQTGAGFLRWLCDDDAFVNGRYDTSLIADRWRHGPSLGPEERALVATAALAGRRTIPAAPAAPAMATPSSAWAEAARREALRR